MLKRVVFALMPGFHYCFISTEDKWQQKIADFYARQFLREHFQPVYISHLNLGYTYPDAPRFTRAEEILENESSVAVTSLIRPSSIPVGAYEGKGRKVIEVVPEHRWRVRLSFGEKEWRVVPADGAFREWAPAREEVFS